jgi:hypothetical protein
MGGSSEISRDQKGTAKDRVHARHTLPLKRMGGNKSLKSLFSNADEKFKCIQK